MAIQRHPACAIQELIFIAPAWRKDDISDERGRWLIFPNTWRGLTGHSVLDSAVGRRPVGAGYSVTSRDLGIFMNEAAEAVSAQDAHTGHIGERMCASGGRVLLQCSVRPVRVVVVDLVVQDQPQVTFAGDQHPV
jgi:hypothetical protein